MTEEPSRIPALHNSEAEAILLALIIRDPDTLIDLPGLVARDFSIKRNRAIFEAIQKLNRTGEYIDVASIHAITSLHNPPVPESYVAEIANEEAPPGLHFTFYKMVRDCRVMRMLHRYAGAINKWLQEPSHNSVEELVAEVERAALRIGSEVESLESWNDLSDIMAHEADDLEYRLSNPASLSRHRIPTGFSEIDNTIIGLAAGEMAVVAARPSAGKTALAIQLMLNSGVKCGFFSLEMGEQEVARRVCSNRSGLSWRYMEQGLATTQQRSDFNLQAHSFPSDLILIDDTPAITVEEFKAKCRRMVAQDDVKMIVIDYLQIMRVPAGPARLDSKLGEICKEVKATLKELRIPGIVLAQLNRGLEKEKREPMMSDIRECGQLEQDADHIWMIVRPNGIDQPEFRIHCLKGRNSGVFPTAELLFDSTTQNLRSP